MYEYIDKSILPLEYGGDDGAIKNLTGNNHIILN